MLINQSIFLKSSERIDQCPSDLRKEFAFIGRSNVGKSSLLNMLSSNAKLAKVSSTPGKTRLINHFLINNSWYLVDLPGYGYAKTSKATKEKFSKIVTDYLENRDCITNLFLLIDVRLEPQKIDLDFLNFLGTNEIPFSIVFTKSDKLSQSKLKTNVDNYSKFLLTLWEELPPIFITSSLNKNGKDDILAYIETIL